MRLEIKAIKFAFAIHIKGRATFSVFSENPSYSDVRVIFDTETATYFIRDNDQLLAVSHHGNCVYSSIGDPVSDAEFKDFILDGDKPKRGRKSAEKQALAEAI